MKLVVLFFLLAVVALGAVCVQSENGHKSKAEIVRMTPEQRVEEYGKEFVRHHVWHSEYLDTITEHIERDGLKPLAVLVRLIDEFDPNNSEGSKAGREGNSQAATVLLSTLDGSSFRLRAFEEGRSAIAAVQRVAERMKAAHYDIAPNQGERSPQTRYESILTMLEEMRGISGPGSTCARHA